MSFPIEGVVHYRELRREHLHAFARRLRIGASAFHRELNKMVNGIEAAAAELEDEFLARTDVPPAYRASRSRMLRSIRFLPIASMVKQLQAA